MSDFESIVKGALLHDIGKVIQRACPEVIRDMIRTVLKNLKNEGKVICTGRGPGAQWRRKGNTLKRG